MGERRTGDRELLSMSLTIELPDAPALSPDLQAKLAELIEADAARWFSPAPIYAAAPLPRCHCRGIMHTPECPLAFIT